MAFASDVLEDRVVFAILGKPAHSRSEDEVSMVLQWINDHPCRRQLLGPLEASREPSGTLSATASASPSSAAVRQLCREATLLTVDRGAIIFKQGQLGSAVFAVLSGTCDIRFRGQAAAWDDAATAGTTGSGDAASSPDPLTEALGPVLLHVSAGAMLGDAASLTMKPPRGGDGKTASTSAGAGDTSNQGTTTSKGGLPDQLKRPCSVVATSICRLLRVPYQVHRAVVARLPGTISLRKLAVELHRLRMCRGWSRSSVGFLAKWMQHRVFDQGARIVRQGHEVHNVYILLRGSAVASTTVVPEDGSSEAQRVELEYMSAPCIFGAHELVQHVHRCMLAASGNTQRTASDMYASNDSVDSAASASNDQAAADAGLSLDDPVFRTHSVRAASTTCVVASLPAHLFERLVLHRTAGPARELEFLATLEARRRGWYRVRVEVQLSKGVSTPAIVAEAVQAQRLLCHVCGDAGHHSSACTAALRARGGGGGGGAGGAGAGAGSSQGGGGGAAGSGTNKPRLSGGARFFRVAQAALAAAAPADWSQSLKSFQNERRSLQHAVGGGGNDSAASNSDEERDLFTDNDARQALNRVAIGVRAIKERLMRPVHRRRGNKGRSKRLQAGGGGGGGGGGGEASKPAVSGRVQDVAASEAAASPASSSSPTSVRLQRHAQSRGVADLQSPQQRRRGAVVTTGPAQPRRLVDTEGAGAGSSSSNEAEVNVEAAAHPAATATTTTSATATASHRPSPISSAALDTAASTSTSTSTRPQPASSNDAITQQQPVVAQEAPQQEPESWRPRSMPDDLDPRYGRMRHPRREGVQLQALAAALTLLQSTGPSPIVQAPLQQPRQRMEHRRHTRQQVQPQQEQHPSQSSQPPQLQLPPSQQLQPPPSQLQPQPAPQPHQVPPQRQQPPMQPHPQQQERGLEQWRQPSAMPQPGTTQLVGDALNVRDMKRVSSTHEQVEVLAMQSAAASAGAGAGAGGVEDPTVEDSPATSSGAPTRTASNSGSVPSKSQYSSSSRSRSSGSSSSRRLSDGPLDSGEALGRGSGPGQGPGALILGPRATRGLAPSSTLQQEGREARKYSPVREEDEDSSSSSDGPTPAPGGRRAAATGGDGDHEARDAGSPPQLTSPSHRRHTGAAAASGRQRLSGSLLDDDESASDSDVSPRSRGRPERRLSRQYSKRGSARRLSRHSRSPRRSDLTLGRLSQRSPRRSDASHGSAGYSDAASMGSTRAPAKFASTYSGHDVVDVSALGERAHRTQGARYLRAAATMATASRALAVAGQRMQEAMAGAGLTVNPDASLRNRRPTPPADRTYSYRNRGASMRSTSFHMGAADTGSRAPVSPRSQWWRTKSFHSRRTRVESNQRRLPAPPRRPSNKAKSSRAIVSSPRTSDESGASLSSTASSGGAEARVQGSPPHTVLPALRGTPGASGAAASAAAPSSGGGAGAGVGTATSGTPVRPSAGGGGVFRRRRPQRHQLSVDPRGSLGASDRHLLAASPITTTSTAAGGAKSEGQVRAPVTATSRRLWAERSPRR